MGHVGRFDPAKNHEFLLKIFCELKKNASDAKLMLVGGGNGKEKIEREVEQLGLEVMLSLPECVQMSMS